MKLNEAKAIVEAALGVKGDEWRGNMGNEYVSWGDKFRDGPTLVTSYQRGRTEAWVLNCRVFRRVEVTCADDLEELIDIYEEACRG